jgi:acetyl esterase
MQAVELGPEGFSARKTKGIAAEEFARLKSIERKRMRLSRLFLLTLAALCGAAVAAGEPMAPVGEARIYKRVGERELKLYALRPENWKASDRRPAIVFFHGGGWAQGVPNQFNQHCTYFASRGLVCIQVEYRLVTARDGSNPGPVVCIQDARTAMRWVRSHATELGIDPQRIAAGGGSAGGHLAAQVGMMSTFDDPQDDRKISARADALLLFNPVLDNGPGGFGTKAIGDRYPEFSPAHNVSPDDPPAILFLGTEDKLIPVATLEKFRAAMHAAGVRCELHLYEGQGHGFFNAKNTTYFHRTTVAADRFLASLGWLTGAPTLAAPDREQK